VTFCFSCLHPYFFCFPIFCGMYASGFALRYFVCQGTCPFIADFVHCPAHLQSLLLIDTQLLLKHKCAISSFVRQILMVHSKDNPFPKPCTKELSLFAGFSLKWLSFHRSGSTKPSSLLICSCCFSNVLLKSLGTTFQLPSSCLVSSTFCNMLLSGPFAFKPLR
jgi:hypothetical protein